MTFELIAETLVATEDCAALSIKLQPDNDGGAWEVPIFKWPFAGTVEVPEGLNYENKSLSLSVRAFFRRGSQNTSEAAVRLPAGGFLRGLRVSQTSPDFIEGRVDHRREYRGVFLGQCTVYCPTSGDSRSGRNVCIECQCKRGTVKICC